MDQVFGRSNVCNSAEMTTCAGQYEPCRSEDASETRSLARSTWQTPTVTQQPGEEGAKEAPSTSESLGQSGHLSDDAIVVRGGVMNRSNLIESAARCRAKTGRYGLSFFAWPGLDAGLTALRVKADHSPGLNPLGHSVLRESTAGEMQQPDDSGRAFVLEQTGSYRGHYTLWFPSEPTPQDWDRLERMFRPAKPNPARGR